MLLSSSFWKGIAGAVIGGLLLLLGVHLYTDHAALHALVNLVNQNAARPAQAVPPSATPTP